MLGREAVMGDPWFEAAMGRRDGEKPVPEGRRITSIAQARDCESARIGYAMRMTPIVLVPGLFCTPLFYAAQLPLLWTRGPVQVANHTRDAAIAAVASRILDEAPPRFALAGHSMGGYIAFEMLRQAPQRIARVAFLDTSARPDVPEQTKRRLDMVDLASRGRYGEIADLMYGAFVHPSRLDDAELREGVRRMARDTGADAFIRQEHTIISRPDSRPMLATIRCPALVVVGADDALTPPELAAEIAEGIPGAQRVIIPDCGHMCAMESPDAVGDALVRWLAS
jgi:pimeloyl-ACP methyl ester carboxylesterase